MGWDTEATKRKLLDAGARQFAAHGFAGARMDAIGRDAAVNKERVYQYFGDKRGLYAAVLADQLDALLEGIEITGTGAGAVGGYAGRVFDRFQSGALAARLLAWESLELDSPAAAEHRARLCAQSARGIQAALPGLTPEAAAHLLLSTITLAAGWWTLAHLARVVLAGPVTDEERRAIVVQQATGLAATAHEDRS
ncbi:TetR/AcrR family transcriptional regulator [Microbacterium bovistercoris]|uniref:TetR/AcrR family transcriptional regulator n=1 Tax=Microbacterium bovistercoris TaxID=2293570 RepID=A0A371NPQ8_9MICO|nr:TetR/AcrR family transcriptional regulator [Microbacterium bovistercoris]REJ04140.1 TetR/AcrR family transcriptional regulator [Microbacterium bovistercoris]